MTSVEQVRKVWHRAASFPANKEGVYPDHAKAQEFEHHRGKRVLEYGCGGGSDAMSYLRRDCTVWYVDIVPENVAAAGRRIEQAGLASRAYGLVIDESAKIPIAGGYFDVVNAHGVLHHIEDPGPVLAEFHRLLKPGGLVYAMLYAEDLWNRFLPEIRDLVNAKRCSSLEEAFGWCSDGEGVPYARSYAEWQGKELLKSQGFELVSAFEYNQGYFRTFKAVKP